ARSLGSVIPQARVYAVAELSAVSPMIMFQSGASLPLTRGILSLWHGRLASAPLSVSSVIDLSEDLATTCFFDRFVYCVVAFLLVPKGFVAAFFSESPAEESTVVGGGGISFRLGLSEPFFMAREQSSAWSIIILTLAALCNK